MEKIKILLVEDDSKKKDMISCYLDREPDLFVVGVAHSKEDAIYLIRMLDIDVVLMDGLLNGNELHSVEAVLEINSIKPSKMIMVTFADRQELILEAFANGVTNYIINAHVEEIPDAVRAAYRNRSTIHFIAANLIRQDYVRLKRVELQRSLTPMETGILRFIYQGLTQAEIMNTLHISESTVKKHVNKIIKKIGTQSSKEAARKANMKGIIEDVIIPT